MTFLVGVSAIEIFWINPGRAVSVGDVGSIAGCARGRRTRAQL